MVAFSAARVLAQLKIKWFADFSSYFN